MCSILSYFFFNDPATTEIYTLSLHDALPICRRQLDAREVSELLVGGELELAVLVDALLALLDLLGGRGGQIGRHTSELQSHVNLVCRLLLEKKKKKIKLI